MSLRWHKPHPLLMRSMRLAELLLSCELTAQTPQTRRLAEPPYLSVQCGCCQCLLLHLSQSLPSEHKVLQAHLCHQQDKTQRPVG